ncbi:hypothetical protein CEXT_375881 [Caerostris extrusa]|uniref:Uncharacterized protein n=1 Tax=Caerostris extrusa TaxID=172846 RepID=A0AAV4VU73_CAEEX|nr:hypothetical protein CEXT_375881 [Caerostris extrusa]
MRRYCKRVSYLSIPCPCWSSGIIVHHETCYSIFCIPVDPYTFSWFLVEVMLSAVFKTSAFKPQHQQSRLELCITNHHVCHQSYHILLSNESSFNIREDDHPIRMSDSLFYSTYLLLPNVGCYLSNKSSLVQF